MRQATLVVLPNARLSCGLVVVVIRYFCMRDSALFALKSSEFRQTANARNSAHARHWTSTRRAGPNSLGIIHAGLDFVSFVTPLHS